MLNPQLQLTPALALAAFEIICFDVSNVFEAKREIKN